MDITALFGKKNMTRQKLPSTYCLSHAVFSIVCQTNQRYNVVLRSLLLNIEMTSHDYQLIHWWNTFANIYQSIIQFRHHGNTSMSQDARFSCLFYFKNFSKERKIKFVLCFSVIVYIQKRTEILLQYEERVWECWAE